MLKTLSEGSFYSLLIDPPDRLTNKPKFYVQLHKPKQKGKLVVNGSDFVLSRDFKESSLVSKESEVCCASSRVQRNDRYERAVSYAAYPYSFERGFVRLDEDDRTSDFYDTWTVQEVCLRDGVDRAFVPFATAATAPNFGRVQQVNNFEVRCRFNPGETAYLNGFPKGCKVVQAKEGVFFVFGGKAGEEVVNELTVIGIHRSADFNTEYAVKPRLEGVLPSPRSGFAWCRLNSSVYLYGGSNHSGILNDVWKLELLSIAFTFNATTAVVQSTQILTCSQVTARVSPCLVGCGNSLYLFGGKGENGFNQPVSTLDLFTLIWSDCEHASAQLFHTNEKIKAIGTKGPFILFYRRIKVKWNPRKCDLTLFDTDLQRSSVIPVSLECEAVMNMPGDFLYFDNAAITKILPGSHYQCHNIPHVRPSLSPLLGAVFDSEMFTDATVGFKAGKEVKLLRCCVAARGTEGAGVLKLIYSNSESVHTFVSYGTFRCAVRYLYTDSIEVPELPAPSYKGNTMQTKVEFFEELRECANFLQMNNLVNLCVVALTQACSVEYSKVTFYADFRRLSWITSEPDLKRFGSLEHDCSELLQPDYRIVCTDGEVEAHKFILFAQSSLFRTVFTGGFERDKEEFRIDFPVKAVQMAKEFMYGDSLKVNSDMLVEMLQMSAYLGVQSLFVACQRQAAQEVNYSNFLATYELAMQLNASHLVQYCEDVYVHSHLGGIRQYQEFLAENEELREKIARLEGPKPLSKKQYDKLPEEERAKVLQEFLSTHPDSPAQNLSVLQGPEYYDPLPAFLEELREIGIHFGKVNLYRPPENILRLSKHVSLEDEQWERGNRFILSSSDSSDSEPEPTS